MKEKILLLLSIGAGFIAVAQPPNNAIFFGGSGDGFQATSFAVSTVSIFSGGLGDGFSAGTKNSAPNNIFSGGAGDGVSFVSNNAIPNSIFMGGIGDGFTAQTNNPASNNIFVGGVGDGFANQGNNSLPNSIFKGGEGDGFSLQSNGALPNNIFAGGEGDGWNAVFLALGPVPVTLVRFTAESVGSQHRVKWTTSSEINFARFEVQRSPNGRDFSTLGSVLTLGIAGNGAAYQFTVDQPLIGNNFYRLKLIDNDQSFSYSNIVLIKEAAGLQVRIFPNPTAELLYVRIPAFGDNPLIPATVFDQSGRVVLQTNLIPGTNHALAVQQLPAGVYTLRCSIQQVPFVVRFVKQR